MQDLLKRLKENKISVSLDKKHLKVKFNGAALDASLIETLRANKEELVAYLTKLNNQPLDNGIFPINDGKCFPLSSSQFRLWVLSQIEASNIAYNMPGMYVIEGDLNRISFDNSFLALIDRHENLRTVFKEDERGEIMQFINSVEASGFSIKYKDLRSEIKKEEIVERLAHEEFIKPFDLASGPLMRALLLQAENTKWIFIYVMHHIIGDGWSMHILLKELLLLYNAYSNGEANPLMPLRIQYKDYTVWQKRQLHEDLLTEHKNYWLQQFEGELPELRLSTDRPRPPIKTYRGEIIRTIINSRLTMDLKEHARRQGSTLFMSLLGVLAVLLHLHTNQEDIVIGTPISGRDHIDLENLVGFFLNTLALRIRFKGEESYNDLLENINRVTVGGYEHQIYPFNELVNELRLRGDMSRNPLFDVMMILQNTKPNNRDQHQAQGSIKMNGYPGREVCTSKFDLTFDFDEIGDTIHFSIVFNTDIFNNATVEELANHFCQLVSSIVEYPTIPISQLEHLNPEKKKQLAKRYNDAIAEFNSEVSSVF